MNREDAKAQRRKKKTSRPGVLAVSELMMEDTHRIVSDHRIMLGKPVIKGTRIPVELILRKLAEGMTFAKLLQAYPHLTKEDILAAVSYSADVIEREELLVS